MNNVMDGPLWEDYVSHHAALIAVDTMLGIESRWSEAYEDTTNINLMIQRVSRIVIPADVPQERLEDIRPYLIDMVESMYQQLEEGEAPIVEEAPALLKEV